MATLAMGGVAFGSLTVHNKLYYWHVLSFLNTFALKYHAAGDKEKKVEMSMKIVVFCPLWYTFKQSELVESYRLGFTDMHASTDERQHCKLNYCCLRRCSWRIVSWWSQFSSVSFAPLFICSPACVVIYSSLSWLIITECFLWWLVCQPAL